MRVVLDQNCPERVGATLERHEVVHVRRLGWERLTNGELLAAAERAGFDVLLTADQNLSYQQDLSGRRIAVVVVTMNNRAVLLEHVALIQAAVDRASTGSFETVELPRPPLNRRRW